MIKILSLHVYGRVEIYLNKTNEETLKKIKEGDLNYKDFKMKGQYMNRLVLTKLVNLFITRR